MTSTQAGRRPAIHMIDTEADRLTELALGAEDRFPEVSALLLDEVGRATVKTASQIGPDVVRMQSTVAFIDEESGAERSVQLVYPGEADINAGRVSILTLIGAALIGLRQGQSINWPDRSGKRRRLRIQSVSH
ncbi:MULTISPECIES: nucleoside diphosphate kinase regulator [unclassified Sphingobium]|uniref:nucleoside diphosphate kinase regulator n=1 Tax=unclassified Sphingobium TaxID=2611147 RepID=UPI002224375B|nr:MULTISPECIES: nucleoside diphosphate kinase regulator [unclassified Sphingobium]MCW2410504.1 regulator of nucleoside diphosphate kinase [Sphingobium sp. B8D3D]MCW2413803.1 regulator of nucleoside diphosphate kinase [Sphingobium sp. B8D3A]